MHSRSLGTGSVSGSGGELTLRPNASPFEDSKEGHVNGVERWNSHAGAADAGAVAVSVDDSKVVDQSASGYEDPITLTQSTHSLLFTERARSVPFAFALGLSLWILISLSVPFAFALGILAMTDVCLVLALFNNLDGWNPRNPLNVPVGVTLDVKIAQYLAILIGLLMEEEIPESLYLLRMINERTLRQREPNMKYGRFVFSSLLRIFNGYLFLLNMFVVVVQSEGVIDIFFDAMALQFLQQIDDIAFRLAKMDVLGKHLKRATVKKCLRTEFERLPFARRRKMTVFVKIVYLVNLCAMMAGMTVITVKQVDGDYNCDRITVDFGDHIWEDAHVYNVTGGVETWDLIYSYFNGVYIRESTSDGRPIYVEQTKFMHEQPYTKKTGAIIKYCKEEGAWVFMHEHIRKDGDEIDSDCPWLLRSPDTDSFNLLEVPGDWSIWTGTINIGATFHTSCNWCDSDAECNYHGTCVEGTCDCKRSEDDHYPLFTGSHCEFPRPCPRLGGNGGTDDIWNLVMVDEQIPWKTYNRGVYLHAYGVGFHLSHPLLSWLFYALGNYSHRGGSNDDLVLIYSGSRWFAAVYEGGACKSRQAWLNYAHEFHAFWDRVYTENTGELSVSKIVLYG
ncbi:hypothetical protein ACHAWF_015965 [Thalassiosira exigua]